jgi:hypothetical protein
MAGVWLFCVRNRVRHRIVVKLSFAHGRPKLLATAGQGAVREEPSPADIVYSKRYSLFELYVSGSMSFFGTGV